MHWIFCHGYQCTCKIGKYQLFITSDKYEIKKNWNGEMWGLSEGLVGAGRKFQRDQDKVI